MSEPITITADQVLSTIAKMVAEHPDGYGYRERVAEITGVPWTVGQRCQNVIARNADPDLPEEKRDWQAACIVGEAVTRLIPGLTPQAIGAVGSTQSHLVPLFKAGASTMVSALRRGEVPGVGRVSMTAAAAEALREAQRIQDSGRPWAAALAGARHAAADQL